MEKTTVFSSIQPTLPVSDVMKGADKIESTFGPSAKAGMEVAHARNRAIEYLNGMP